MLTIENMKANQPDDVHERAGYWQGNALVLSHRLEAALAALKQAERLLDGFGNAVGGNEQHRDHGEFFKGYNTVTNKVRHASWEALPAIRSAIAHAEGSAT